ncbi:MAG: TolC family protein [Chitinophagales bacterium]|nr:TolC family protein [Chitinophagales bacterium]
MKKYSSLFMFMMLVCLGNAQTLNELIGSAVTNYPKIKELKGNVALADAKIQLAKSGYQPNIAINGSYNYVAPVSKANFLGNEIQFQPNHNYNTYLSVNQTIWDFGRTNASVQRAKEEQAQVKENLKASELGLAYQVAVLYNNIVLLQKNIALQDAQIKLAYDNYKLVENKIKNGDALSYDLVNADVRVKVAENKKVDLLNQLEKQLNLLKFYTGNEQAQVTATSFESGKDAASNATSGNMDIALANSRLHAAQVDYKTSISNFLPNLFANGNAGWKNTYLPNIKEMRFNYVVGAGLNIPIYDAGKALAQRKMAKLAIETAKQNLLYAQQAANKDVLQAQADFNANQTRLQNTAAIVKQAEAAFNLAQSRYKNGTLTWLDLENARISAEDARFSLIQLEYQLALNKLEMNRIAGVRFWEGQ